MPGSGAKVLVSTTLPVAVESTRCKVYGVVSCSENVALPVGSES